MRDFESTKEIENAKIPWPEVSEIESDGQVVIKYA